MLSSLALDLFLPESSSLPLCFSSPPLQQTCLTAFDHWSPCNLKSVSPGLGFREVVKTRS